MIDPRLPSPVAPRPPRSRTLLPALLVACLAWQSALALEEARVLSATPIPLLGQIVCSEAPPRGAPPESSVSVRGFRNASRSGLSFCSEGPPARQERAAAPEASTGMRGFSRSGQQTPRESGDIAGYRVSYRWNGKVYLTTLPERPGSTIGIDEGSGQIVTLNDQERVPEGDLPRFEEGEAAYKTGDHARAREVWGWLASHGHGGAQNKMGNLYYDGKGVPRNLLGALRWDKLGAEQGHPRSMNNLGYMYEHGEGVAQDDQQARYWYVRAAEKADPYGLTSLAILYQKGIGMEANPEMALENYRRAAQLGHANAQNGLGTLYELGQGVPRSDSEAARWYKEAAEQGDARARRNLERLYQRNPGLRGERYEEYVPYASVSYPLPKAKTATVEPADAAPAQFKAARPTPPPEKSRELVERLPKARNGNPNGIALIIGNQKYDHRDIPPVSYAANDAETMKQFAARSLGFEPEQITVLGNASKGTMEAYFGSESNPEGKLAKWVKPGETDLFIYYSGHGAPGLKDGRGYLLPVDTDPSMVTINGYPLDLLYANLGKLGARSVTVVLEACFSGQSSGGTLVPRSSSILVKPKLPQMQEGATVFGASAADQVASWDEEYNLGLMTRYFVQGAAGDADENRDGNVTTAELQKFVSHKVSLAARSRYNREQQPSVMGAGPVVLTRGVR